MSLNVKGSAVQAEGLAKHYDGSNGGMEAVRDVDLTVESGEVFGFLGPNGAGKSTTVKMLTTLLSITSGSARVAGVDVASEPDEVRRRIGVALQEAGLDPRQTGARAAGAPGAAVRPVRTRTRRPAPRSCSLSSSSRTPPTAASRATRAA